jgi:hypothetical protein
MALSLVIVPVAPAASIKDSAVPGTGLTKSTARIAAPTQLRSTSAIKPAVETELLGSDMETWPGPWTMSGSPTWGQTTQRFSEGSNSAYCAGSSIAAPGPYADDMWAWMIAGPYDLTDYEAASVFFDTWMVTEG